MTKAAIQGDYCDLKFIKSRKVAVISIEIPIEAATAFVAAFGTPSPATGVPVALARLEETKAEKPKRDWEDISRTQQAGIACNDINFRRFITEVSGIEGIAIMDLDMAAEEIRARCGVQSRSELDKSRDAARKWDRIYSDFQMWKAGAAA